MFTSTESGEMFTTWCGLDTSARVMRASRGGFAATHPIRATSVTSMHGAWSRAKCMKRCLRKCAAVSMRTARWGHAVDSSPDSAAE